MRLKDKVILVTGSSTGIGEGMARIFAREGARVVVHGIRDEDAKPVAAAIAKQGGRAVYVSGELADPSAPAKIISGVIEQCGRIDCLVNNAGVTTRGTLESTDVDSFDRIIAINLRAPFLLIQAALPHFRRQGGGRIINIGSINAYCGERKLLPYSISKGGLMTLTRNIADAHGAEGLRINQFNVGWTLTAHENEVQKGLGMPDNWSSRLPKSVAPSGRILSPEDLAWAAVYFLSDEAPLINGAVLDFEQYPVIGRNPEKKAE